jgi:hypothetical protein
LRKKIVRKLSIKKKLLLQLSVTIWTFTDCVADSSHFVLHGVKGRLCLQNRYGTFMAYRPATLAKVFRSLSLSRQMPE